MMGWTGLRSQGGAALSTLVFAAFLAGGLAVAVPADAQTAGEGGGALGGFRTDPDKPIEVEADSLEVEDTKSTATFIGNVRVAQGEIRMKADRIVVFYAPRSSNGSGIERLRATGNVFVSSPDEQSASGEWANYLIATREIEMGDAVVLRQGENVIRGAKLFVDLNSGRARVVGGGTGVSGETGGTGRVKGLFQPGGN
ncbi:Cell envelope biogenesis YhbN [Parvibaculum lavamentivorans DS-1]|uniref:Cell envelope biogenesis YhbN n=1 Tax=Parvibaculum lavamentivorans (strain DS-1 / DSM 13023 / NCIMB 13966) TaxID=402881 RepID=A7HPI4_PARL1|nr:lipopolysaccharide transport periplasmic protein LptA [Parvibaculum lavamentivorans]ABS61817.1 Cell envelope biogenesis YhbN [Parvibaculum lavamentivorans DS-1]